MAVALTELLVGDPPDLWTGLGFSVDGEIARVGAVDVRLHGGPDHAGICGWRLTGLDPAVSELDGLPVGHAGAPPDPAVDATSAHANGISGIDHVVVTTPDLGRTVDALTAAGLDLRRVRDAGRDGAGRQRQQAFFWLGAVILEVVGPAQPAGDAPPLLWGLAFTGDLEVAAALLGSRLRPPKPAVQKGRMIATLDRSAGSTVPIVIMSAHPRADGGRASEVYEPPA